MTTFNIPEIGDQITLIEDWTFDIHAEGRNKSVFDRLGETNINFYRSSIKRTITLPAGTILKVDRIFIRQKMADWSSLTFYIIDCPDPIFKPHDPSVTPTSFMVGKKVVRFWAKLGDCNRIQF